MLLKRIAGLALGTAVLAVLFKRTRRSASQVEPFTKFELFSAAYNAMVDATNMAGPEYDYRMSLMQVNMEKFEAELMGIGKTRLAVFRLNPNELLYLASGSETMSLLGPDPKSVRSTILAIVDSIVKSRTRK